MSRNPTAALPAKMEGYLTYYYEYPDKQFYAIGAQLTAQLDLGDAIYQSLASKQLVIASDQHLESRRQKRTLAAAQGYFDLG